MPRFSTQHECSAEVERDFTPTAYGALDGVLLTYNANLKFL